MDRNALAEIRSHEKQNAERLIKEIILPLVQAVQTLNDRLVILETPAYKRLWLKTRYHIGLWLARRRAKAVAEVHKTC